MNDLQSKLFFGGFVLTLVTAIQLYAWATGHNGQVFALTSAAMGGITGALLGFKFSAKTSK